jgi:putative ABC transport system permease protein
VPIPFIVPWFGLAVILALPLLASLAVTVWPATRAARIKPAVALRIAD